jgi:hypothetical protein
MIADGEWRVLDSLNYEKGTKTITTRLKVPFGWLVRFQAYMEESRVQDNQTSFHSVTVNFVFDPFHLWKIQRGDKILK